MKAILDADGRLPQQVNEFLYGNGGDEENEDTDEEWQEQQKALWLEHEAKIVEDIKLKMEALEALREEAEKEANVLKKQELLVRCRKEQAILEAASTNISDVGKKLDMVIKFLGTMCSRLAEMDGKLAAIQDEVTALHEDMRRLTGKPVLDVYEEWRQRLLEEAKCVQKGVYIESEVVRAGPKNNFQEDETDNPKRLVTGAVREFLEGARATVIEVHEKEGMVTVSFDDPVGSAFPEEYRLRKEGSAETAATVPRSMVHTAREIEIGAVVTVDWKNVLLLSGPAGGGSRASPGRAAIRSGSPAVSAMIGACNASGKSVSNPIARIPATSTSQFSR